MISSDSEQGVCILLQTINVLEETRPALCRCSTDLMHLNNKAKVETPRVEGHATYVSH